MKFYAAALALLLLGGCEWPFNTTLYNSGDLLSLTVNYDGRRITDTLHLELSWTEVTVEYFQHYTIERKNSAQQFGKWELIATLTDEYAATYIDTINDDATYDYRFSLVDQTNQYLTSETSVTIRPTTHLTFPTEVDSLHLAVSSSLMDDGDSIVVLAGNHRTRPLNFGGRRLVLTAPQGAAETILSPFDSSDADWSRSLIRGKFGIIEGLSIIESYGESGGALWIGGDLIVRQCFIAGNRARPFHAPRVGTGGGIYLADSSRIENSIIYRNVASFDGDGIQIRSSSNVFIVNCTIYENEGVGLSDGGSFEGSSGHATVINTLFAAHSGGDVPIYTEPDATPTKISYSNISGAQVDPGSSHYDPSNVTVLPLFRDAAIGDFRLADGSPLIDAGNPDPAYNDTDGTRNDIGAFGGPGGEWSAPSGLAIGILPVTPN